MVSPSKIQAHSLRTRHSLLGRLKNSGDNESWKEFFDTYWKLIYEVSLKAGLSEVEAQEVVQETVIAVHKHMPRFDYDPAKGTFKGWLLNLTRWRIQDQLRKRLPAQHSPRRPDDTRRTATVERIPDDAAPVLDSVWDAEWRKNLVDAAVERVKRKVNAKHYQIFDLYVIQKWPARRITAVLGVNIGQVYLARHRVANLVRKEIQSLEKTLV